MNNCRRFVITSNAPRAQAGPSAVVYARTPHKAAEIFARRFAGCGCYPLTILPAREDEAGALWSGWRAGVARSITEPVPEDAPTALFIREQIGGFDVPEQHADLFVIDELSPT